MKVFLLHILTPTRFDLDSILWPLWPWGVFRALTQQIDCVHFKVFLCHGHCGLMLSLVHWHNNDVFILRLFYFMATVVLRCLCCIDTTEWCVHSSVLLFYGHYTIVLRCLCCIDTTEWCIHSKVFLFYGHCDCGLKVSLLHWHNRMMCSFFGIAIYFMATVV